MSLKRVVIVSSQGLFRDGLKQMLARVAQVHLASSCGEAEELARAQKVDVMIVDQADDQVIGNEAISRLLSLPRMKVITVSLAAGDLQIYQHERVVEASPEALIAAVLD